MVHVYGLTAFLVLLVFNNIPSGATILSKYWHVCDEELGLTYTNVYDPPELAKNKTCMKKCIYEKEGKLDSDGNFIVTEPSEAVTSCISRIKTDNLCKKVNLFDTCVTRNTKPAWKKYESCENLTTYDDNFDEDKNPCYDRCRMIVSGNLHHDGKINMSTFNFDQKPNNQITHQQALDKCNEIVKDENYCVKDLNMYYCVSHLLTHDSLKILNLELECAKENNVYPFNGAESTGISHPCFDRCLLIKSGNLNVEDIIKSESFKTLEMNETQLTEVFEACKKTMRVTNVCARDLYFYDCIRNLQHVDSDFLKKQIECAQETKSSLVSYREPYRDDDICNTRCIMIKDNQLDSDGVVNKEHFKKFNSVSDIIDSAVNECNEKNTNRTCASDVIAYHCVWMKIKAKIHEICENEVKNSQVPDENGGCYQRCVLYHEGDVNANGEFSIEVFKSTGKIVEAIEKAISSCKSEIVDENECARTVNRFVCVSIKLMSIED